ncbi:hypothetical protein DDIC_07835 [Desulfovibrio desulfuricans]|uniref:Uncharacterized protein n=1 Tax=Desulfovibrio desulfuricans TaxID=876 RepID=A0A4P7UHM5_DESDE|nr:DUF6361 family protein [Desulfovibrio desulfuricans]QCC85785.1 hypothetical protein DDIC_07835 [Desulfovibrio desulfuricans]
MQLGWIDFSREDRKKALSVIALLTEEGVLDELGIGPVRDGFADVFFPGTSTIQTRAKYFFLVPYALDFITRQRHTNPQEFLSALDILERKCGQRLAEQNAEGTIGERTIAAGGWVKRTPATIYWSGIRKYGLLKSPGPLSLSEYARLTCSETKQQAELKRSGYSPRDAAGNAADDSDAGKPLKSISWILPPYPQDLLEHVCMTLSHEEALHLKERIETTQARCLLAHILRTGNREILDIDDFNAIPMAMTATFPPHLQEMFLLARAFSSLIYEVRIRYNAMLPGGLNQEAEEAWSAFTGNMDEVLNLDVSAGLERLGEVNKKLLNFLVGVQDDMRNKNSAALDARIKQREIALKGEQRAKLLNGDAGNTEKWIGGRRLEYRFSVAKRMLRDIFQGLDG